ncbi:polysaccharide pyruvyl transferase family protein [Salegentibacter sediminis]|uniref:polysaccharide pyruvyl transferase family protein n=1 Tax=Salegentibacter sediminis TaxID=1930251 RepID=UPI0012FF867D|nr:polysaccharide pyruvyl transferase family protein [Salegentibacter sediminis]
MVSYKRNYNFRNKSPLFAIGSILNGDLNNSVIWGSGFIHPTEKKIGKPFKVLAVRGKYSAEILKKQGISFNGVYGDPALLFPSIYNPSISKKFKLGIIPHYTELKDFEKHKEEYSKKNILLISPMVKEDIHNFIDQILSCENIASSSLHGLIVADAYGIPSIRFKFKNELVGGDFKFKDYYSGVGLEEQSCMHIKEVSNINRDEIINQANQKPIKFDAPLLKNTLINFFKKEY